MVRAVTTAWDTHHSVISMMGDRFVLVRLDSSETATRMQAARRSMRNPVHEGQMRQELAEAVAGVLAQIRTEFEPLDAADETALLDAAQLVTMTRTAVEYDYAGNVIDAQATEMPTRFAKQLGHVVRVALAVRGRRCAWR